MSTRVLLADDHTLVRAGIRSLLESIEGVEVEALSWTLSVTTPLPAPVTAAGPAEVVENQPAEAARQALYDVSIERWVDAPVYLRRELAPGQSLPGPALITEEQTTTVVSSVFEAFIDADRSIIMSRREAAAGGDRK